MKKFLPTLFAFQFSFFAFQSLHANGFVEGTVIFKLKQNEPQTLKNIETFLQNFGLSELKPLFQNHRTRQTELSKIYEAKLNSSVPADELAKQLAQQKGIAYAEPRFVNSVSETPNDPQFPQQTHLSVIHATAAWDLQHTNGTVLVGIVDTGISLSHPDLAANVWQNANEIPGNNLDDDANGYVDDVYGWDFAGNGNNNPDNDPTDTQGHGTHTSGDVAAVTNNAVGVSGISWNAKIMAVKAGPGTTDITHGYEAIVYAAENGADVINCSWGNSNYSLLGEDVVEYAQTLGSVIVAAAGNAALETGQTPAIYKGVLGVASTGNTDLKSGFSNYSNFLGISAPGESVLGTSLNGNYVAQSGTSFSSPLTAGVVALVKAKNPTWTNQQALEQTRISADANFYTLNTNFNKKLGYGRLDAQRALTVSSPSVRVLGIVYNDASGGNGNGIPEPGESVAIEVSIKNYLLAVQNLNVSLTENSSFLALTNSSVTVNNLLTLATQTITFNTQIASSMPVNHKVLFSFTFSEPTSGYSDWQFWEEILLPAYVTHNSNGITFSLTDRGSLGFLANSSGGNGEGFKLSDGVNLLWSGNLLVGKSASQVSDANHGGNGSFDDDFTKIGNFIEISTPGSVSDQQSYVKFNDSAASSPLGVQVSQVGLSFNSVTDSSYVILSYDIRNTTSSDLTGIYVGLYFDWDINETTYNNNSGGYDATNQIAWLAGPSGANQKFCGIKLLTSAPASYRVISSNEIWDADGFSETDKWNALSGGFVQTTGSANDFSHLLSAGPFSIAPNEKIRVAFAVLGTMGMQNLVASANASQTKWTQVDPLLNAKESNNAQLVQTFKLDQNFPNPFNPTTKISYELQGKGKAKLTIFNVLGEVVREFELEKTKGEVVWNGVDFSGNAVSSGIYFYRLETESFVQSKKMILLK
ncbi:S8 family serine peptidase [bacterium]|nr:S8 family serine peptidase [bacterium]